MSWIGNANLLSGSVLVGYPITPALTAVEAWCSVTQIFKFNYWRGSILLDSLLSWLTPPRVENITISLIGAAIGTFGGALGGAWAAGKIAAAKERRALFWQEIGDLNAAIDLSFAVCSRSLALKSQHVRALAAAFREQQARIHAHHTGLANGTIPVGTQLVMPHIDLMVIEALRVPIVRLEEAVLEKVAAGGKISQRVITLAGCIESTNDTINNRNALVESIKRGEVPENEKVERMFGLPLLDGSVDMMFSELTLGLANYVDNCIYFSSRLCEDLEDRGKRLRERYPKRIRRGAPKIVSCDFKQVIADGLMPNAEEFAEWERVFVRECRRRREGALGSFGLSSASNCGAPLGL